MNSFGPALGFVGVALAGIACNDPPPPAPTGPAPELSAAATEESEAKPIKKTKPFEIDWVKDGHFEVKGDKTNKGNVIIFKGTYQITLRGFPKGTQWSVGDQKGSTPTGIDIIKVQDMTGRYGEVPLEGYRDFKLDPKAKIEIIRPDGTHAEFELPAAGLGLSVANTLKKVENGPVLFADEGTDDPKPGLSILMLHTIQWKTFGQATTLADVDAVALIHKLEEVKGTKKCTGYTANDGSPMPDLELQLKEHKVVIYDRRKGGEIANKVFPPKNDCPSMTFQSKDATTYDSMQPLVKIEAWLRSQAK